MSNEPERPEGDAPDPRPASTEGNPTDHRTDSAASEAETTGHAPAAPADGDPATAGAVTRTPAEAASPPPGDAVPAEPAPGQPAEADAAQADPAQADPAQADPAQADAAQADPAQADAAQAEPAGGEAAPTAATTPGEGAEAASAAEQATEGDGTGKKRRRKKRRKKGASAEGGDGGDADAKKRETSLPFGRFFDGPGATSRKHAFAAGEVVAGRVARIGDGAFIVDLFGKAEAVVDIYEPHEVPELPAEPEGGAESLPPPAAAIEGEGAHGGAEAAEGTASPEGPAPAEGVGAADAAPPAETGEIQAATGEQPADLAPGAATGAGVSGADAEDASGDGQPAAGQAETPARVDAPADAVAPRAPGAPEDADDASASGDDHEHGHDVDHGHDHDDGPDDDAETFEPESEGPPPEPPPLGAIFRGRIGALSESGSLVLVNRIIDRRAAKARLAHAREKRIRVRGVVFGFNRGGFDVLTQGVRVFCPASGMSLEHITDPHAIVGQKLEFLVAPTKSSGQGIVVTRRSILEREARKAARERLKSLQPGQELEGTVTSIRDFGVLVDIGGVEGLVHLSELGWQRGLKPSEVVSVGESVKVKILKVGQPQGRKRDARVSLSIRAMLPDPWDEHVDSLEEGRPRKGKVVRTTDFGAFVELAPGVEGLLHISELGKDLKHASLALDEGEEIDVVIERVDRKQRRVSLSRLTEAEAQALAEGGVEAVQRPRSVRPGSYVNVVVDRVEHAGLIVRVAGAVGKRARGFLPNRELGDKAGDVRRSFPPGTELEVKVIGTDRDGGLRCSIKAKLVDEERRAVQDYRREAAKQGFGTFGDILRAKLGQSGDG